MAIVRFTDRDRQDTADAREERRVLDELTEKHTVYREADRDQEPLTEGQLRILDGELRIDPSRRTRAEGGER
ncbi:hypothetical protein ACI8AV_19785 [Geodermatophilus sp. SYSU D00804]